MPFTRFAALLFVAAIVLAVVGAGVQLVNYHTLIEFAM